MGQDVGVEVDTAETVSQARAVFAIRRPRLVIGGLATIVLSVLLILWLMERAKSVSTNDARIAAEMIAISSDVSGQIEISLDAVSDLGDDVLCLFEWVVSVYDDTSDILTTLTVEEEGSTVSTSELATVRSRSVGVITIKARLGARDHPLRPEQHLVHILLGASHTCLIDEGSSLCESVV